MGSTNVLFRLGESLLVRLPRQPGGGDAIEKEAHWSNEIKRHLSITIPTIKALGEPAFGYTERWSITHWLDGETAKGWSLSDDTSATRLQLAHDLAEIILSLRAMPISSSASKDNSLRCYRGRPLAEFHELTLQNIHLCRSIKGLNINLDALASIWNDAIQRPAAQEVQKDQWYHGDLVAENLLLSQGKLCAIIDFGGLGIGDATIDLHGAWEIFDPASREHFRNTVNASDAQWVLGRAWALGVSLNAIQYYWNSMPERMLNRTNMLQSILDDAANES